jgi:HK97 family phage major capsid protein
MPTTQEWRDERATILSKAKNIVAAAKSENRDLTNHEQDTLSADMARVKQIDVQMKGRALVDSVIKQGSAEDYHTDGSVFDESAKAGIIQALKSRTLYRTEIDRKALTSGTLLPTAGTGVASGLHPNLFPIASLFPNEPASGPTIRYYRMDGATADVVAEGALKPDSGVTITPVDVALSKIATLANFSDEMVEDASYLIGYLQAELTSAVIVRENKAILDTFTGTSGVLTGTGLATDVVDLVADAISGHEAISGNTPSAVIAHPNVVATIRKAKASTDQYQIDPLTSAPASLHGIRIVSTPATAAGTVWVVSGQGTVIYRRGPITAEIGYGSDGWEHNTRTMRVEQRMATAVVRPSSLTKLTLT